MESSEATMRVSRRRVLRTAALGGTAGLAGCLGLVDDAPSEWAATYGDDDEPTFFFDVTTTDDGGYLAVGSDHGGGSQDGLAAKYDGSGDRLWAETYGGGNYDWFDGVVGTDDGYVLAGTRSDEGGSSAWLLAVDDDGDDEWERTFDRAELTYGWRLRPAVDEGYLLVGRAGELRDWRPWVAKTDAEGEPEWQETYRPEDATSARFNAGLPTDDGYLLTGEVTTADDEERTGYAVAVDADGGVEWTRTYDTGPLERAISDGDGYLVAGGHVDDETDAPAFLHAVDEEGAKRWTETYAEDGYATLTDVVPRQGGGGLLGGGGGDGYVATGAVGSSTDDPEPVLLTVDGEGELETEAEWDADTGAVWAVEPSQDGGYVAAGYVDETPLDDGGEEPRARLETFGSLDGE